MARIHILTLTTILLALLATTTLLATTPLAQAQRPGRQYKGPTVSGILSAADQFIKEAPGIGTITKTICTDGTDLAGGNIRVNCDSIQSPHNEMTIAVDPANPDHIIAGSNDYELFFKGATVVGSVIAGYYTSFDGGTTWTNGHVPVGGFVTTGDPAVAFNRRHGLVHYGVLAFQTGQAAGFSDASIQVNTSTDGGLTFQDPVLVAHGTGSIVTVLHDKPYITVDNNPTSPFYGRLYVTWTRFLFGPSGYVESPIFFSFSDDGGKTFSQPREISGSSSTLCAHPFRSSNTGRCNEDQDSSPIVGPDGTLYVAYINDEFQGAPEFRSQFLAVRSTDGGATFQGPFQAVFPVFDGVNDYPINVDDRQTLSNSQFRQGPAGNLAVDPTSGPSYTSTLLYYTFSDNRNGKLTGDSNTVKTNTDVFVARSNDGGTTWSNPDPILKGKAAKNDQWFPWADVGSDGTLFVAFKDRSYDPDNIQYGETLARSSDGKTFTAQRVDTALSNPNDSRWFTNGGQTNGKATFIGDYEALAVGTDGVAHPLWTDMRVRAFETVPSGRGHNTQDAVTASVA